MLNKNKRNCSTPNFYTMFKQNTGKVSKYRSNITLAKKTYLGVPSNLKKKFPSKNTMVNNKRQYNRHPNFSQPSGQKPLNVGWII